MDNVPTKQFRYFSTFSGIGGFEIGIQKAVKNWEREGQERTRSLQHIPSGRNMADLSEQSRNWPICVGYSEIDKYAIKVYERQFNGIRQNQDKPNDSTNSEGGTPQLSGRSLHQPYGDITKINADELPDFDCLVGGFPCQAFSIAGKRKGFDDTRGTLFFDLARILRAKQPRLFVFENVKGLLSHDNGNTFKTIISTIDELGYDCQWQVLNSKNHGVPQNRERVIIVGHLRGTSRPQVFPIGETNRTADERLGTQDTPGEVASTVRSRYGNGTGSHIVAPVLTPGRLNKRQNGRRFKEDGEPSFTLNTQDRHGIYDGMKIRRLTPVECERLQGFPDDWTKYGVGNEPISDSQRYKMCGNAVTTNVIHDVFEKIFNVPN